MSPEAIRALRDALCGDYVLPIGEEAMIVCRPLPGRALAAATVKDGVLWVALDMDKGAAARHGLVMIEEWRDELMVAVEPLNLPKRPCPLRLVS